MALLRCHAVRRRFSLMEMPGLSRDQTSWHECMLGRTGQPETSKHGANVAPAFLRQGRRYHVRVYSTPSGSALWET